MNKKPKPYGGGRYTKAGYFGFIRSGLRQKSMRWPPKYDVMNAAKRPHQGTDKRRKFDYQCNGCKKWCKADTHGQVGHPDLVSIDVVICENGSADQQS